MCNENYNYQVPNMKYELIYYKITKNISFDARLFALLTPVTSDISFTTTPCYIIKWKVYLCMLLKSIIWSFMENERGSAR